MVTGKKVIFVGLYDKLLRYFDWNRVIMLHPEHEIATLNRFYTKYPKMSPDIIFQNHSQNINYPGTTNWQDNYKDYLEAGSRVILGIPDPKLPNAELMDWDSIYSMLPIERDTSTMVEVITWFILNGYTEINLWGMWMMDRIDSGELSNQLPDMVWACKYYPQEYGVTINLEGGLLMMWEQVLQHFKLRWDDKPNKPVTKIDWRNIPDGKKPYWQMDNPTSKLIVRP